MNILFKLMKGFNDPPLDTRFAHSSPNQLSWDIKTNYIFNDEDSYWWVSDLPFAPNIGWTVYAPPDPFELTDYSSPLVVSKVVLWCQPGHLIVICKPKP